jgi:hypothetical protein
MSEIVVHRLFHPWLHSDFIFFKLSAMGKRHDECLKVLHGFTNKVQYQTERSFSIKAYIMTDQEHCHTLLTARQTEK